MERKLKNLFDFQKFEKNKHLESLIRQSEDEGIRRLSDDELSQVNAAGDNYPSGNGEGGS